MLETTFEYHICGRAGSAAFDLLRSQELKGPGRSKLDQAREEIEALLRNDSTKSYVARKYETTLQNLYNW